MASQIRDWEVVIGLETHVQLSTASKIFSGASTAFGAAPNAQASAVDLALPGADAYYASCLSLPLHAAMTDADVERVVQALKRGVQCRGLARSGAAQYCQVFVVARKTEFVRTRHVIFSLAFGCGFHDLSTDHQRLSIVVR